MFGNVYKGKRVLITGHTGFKGSWLALWLKCLDAEIYGISLPVDKNVNLHWYVQDLKIEKNFFCDISQTKKISKIIAEINPDIIFHLAAQPLVSDSYQKPLNSWATNVIGTANILEAVRTSNSKSAVLVVSTDKCYANIENKNGYTEDDKLGGHDPYSASKAACEILVESFRAAFFSKSNNKVFLSSARAGNVIGGGDWAKNRLIPDMIRASKNSESVLIRSPSSIRPWQHVLDSLSGYLLLGQFLIRKNQVGLGAFNFGPNEKEKQTVLETCKKVKEYLPQLEWTVCEKSSFHETNTLLLNCEKAETILKWSPTWNIDKSIEKTMEWYNEYLDSGKVVSNDQLHNYFADAKQKNMIWSMA